MLPAIYLLVALINLSANLNNYNIKNHPLDIRVRRDAQRSIGNDMGVIFKELRERRKAKSADNERGERRDTENRHFEDPEEDKTELLVIDPKTEEGINVSGNDSTEKKYNSHLLRLLYPDRKVTSTSEAWKRDKRSVDSGNYYNQGINNTANVQTRHLATINNTRVLESNVMSLYARRPYQYSNIYNRTNNTNYARASPYNANFSHGSNGLYQAKLAPYSNEYQREYYKNFTNNNQFNNYKLPINNQFTNNLTNNRLFNNNGYDPNRNIHFNYNQINNNNMSNNNLYHISNGYNPNRNINFNNYNLSKNNGYDPNRNINFNNNNNLSNNNGYDPNRNLNFNNNRFNNNNLYNNNGYVPNRNINYNYNEMNNKNLSNNNLYHNNNGYDPNRNINLNNSRFNNNNNIYHNNNAYNPNRNTNFNYNQIGNNNMSNNNKNNGYDPNRNIHFNYNQINNNNNNFSNNNLYRNNNGYDPNRNIESNNNILSNNKLFIDNSAQNPFLNQVPPAPTSEYRGEPSTTTSTTPFIVESCILCGSAGCPSFFKRIGFLCVPQKH